MSNKKSPNQISKEKNYWRSYNELANTSEYKSFLENEFPEGTFDLPTQFSRKKFLGLMGASLALAGLTSCRRPVEKIIPYINAPEEIIPGLSKNYATTMPFGTNAFGIIVETHEGRPTKIEGNPKHSSSLGAANAFVQASILNLYDPDRAQAPQRLKSDSRWDDFLSFWQKQLKSFEPTDGEGLAILTGSFASPTLYRLKSDLLRKFPKATWTVFDPISDENIYQGTELAIGKKLQPVYNFKSADIVLSIDSDFLYLDSNNVANSKGFSEGRRITSEKDSMNRLYSVESAYTVTGGMADHRLKLKPSEIPLFTLSLAQELQKLGVPVEVKLPDADDNDFSINSKWVKALAVDLATHKSKSVVVAGYRQSAEVHALVFAINDALRNIGKTITYYKADHTEHSSRKDYENLQNRIKSGEVNTLVMIGGNPVFTSDNADFLKNVSRIEHTIHFSEQFNETSNIAEWALPISNYLESWGDAVSFDGTLSVIQPMISPLFDSRSPVEIFSVLSSGELKSGYDLVRSTWQDKFISSSFEKKWRQILHDGILEGSKFKIENKGLKNKNFIRPGLFTNSGQSGLECIFVPSSSVWDGEFSNNGWLMENPDPVTKV
ncbi:MAG: TAT-variant-translocated molybdopterin oxidoreductase, partial [Fidelibacterota bacterium]